MLLPDKTLPVFQGKHMQLVSGFVDKSPQGKHGLEGAEADVG